MSERYDLHKSRGYQLTLLARISERRFEKRLSSLGLSRVKWCVLLAVGQEGLSSPSEIAEFVGIDRTATSRALRALENQTLITRQGGEKDRRTRAVSITGKGAETLSRAIAIARENATYFAKKLSWYEHDTLDGIIRKLMAGETRDVPEL